MIIIRCSWSPTTVEIKALCVLAENPKLSDPDMAHVKKSIEALDLLVVQDIFMT